MTSRSRVTQTRSLFFCLEIAWAAMVSGGNRPISQPRPCSGWKDAWRKDWIRSRNEADAFGHPSVVFHFHFRLERTQGHSYACPLRESLNAPRCFLWPASALCSQACLFSLNTGRLFVYGSGVSGYKSVLGSLANVFHAAIQISDWAFYPVYETESHTFVHGDTARSICLDVHCQGYQDHRHCFPYHHRSLYTG